MVTTVFEQSSQSVIIGLILCALAVLILITLIVLSLLKKIRMKTIVKFSVVATIAFALGIGINNYQENKISDEMVQKIEKNVKIENLQIVNDHNISCLNNYKGSIDAVIWKQNDKNHIGVLIGKEKNNTCVYQLASTNSNT